MRFGQNRQALSQDSTKSNTRQTEEGNSGRLPNGRFGKRHMRYLFLAVLGLLGFAVSARFCYGTVKRAIVQSEEESLKSLASANALSLENNLEDKADLLSYLYSGSLADREALDRVMNQVFCDKYFYRIQDYMLLPEEKRSVCVRAAMEPERVICGPLEYRSGGYYVFYMTKAVYLGGQYAGVVQYEWNLDRIYRDMETLSNLHINHNGYTIVRNKDGRLIMSAEGGKEDILSDTFPMAENRNETQKASAQTFWFYELHGGVPVPRQELTAYSSVRFGDELFTVYVSEDYALLVKPIERMSLYLSALGVLLVVWLLGFWWLYLHAQKKEEQLRLALRYERQLNEAGKALEKQEEIMRIYNRDKEQTALQGALAHEFNNQMTPILLYAEIFREDTRVSALLPEETEALYEAAERCSTLSQQLLEFARHGRAERKKEDFNASEEVRSSLRMLQKAVPQNIRLTARISQREFIMNGQRGMLGQIILNLANNAIYSMTQREDAELKLLFGESRQTPGMLCLIVEDNGCGIPEKEQYRVFEPFYTTKPLKEGNGIGLTVVARLVGEHEGTLEVQSEEGRGTRFMIELPYLRAEDAEEE